MHNTINFKHCVSTFIIGLFAFNMHAQTKIEAELTCKRSDNSITIVAEILDTEEYDPIPNLEIEFISILDTINRSLGKTVTNEAGIATMEDIPFSTLLLDLEHRFYISYSVSETEQYIAGMENISFQEVDIRLTFEEIDSIKQINVTISSWDETGKSVPIEDLDAYLYVPRLFSLLPIGEIYTEGGGIGMMLFPTDLPGGKDGELTVIVKVEDNDEYGNVEISNATNWAKPTSGNSEVLPRALWSTRPPMWMIVSFSVLMIGVWFHYGWIILNLFRIKSKSSGSDVIIYEE